MFEQIVWLDPPQLENTHSQQSQRVALNICATENDRHFRDASSIPDSDSEGSCAETLLQPVPKAAKYTTLVRPYRKVMKPRDVYLTEDRPMQLCRRQDVRRQSIPRSKRWSATLGKPSRHKKGQEHRAWKARDEKGKDPQYSCETEDRRPIQGALPHHRMFPNSTQQILRASGVRDEVRTTEKRYRVFRQRKDMGT